MTKQHLFLAILALAAMPSSVFGIHFAVNNTATHKICMILEANITGTLVYPKKANATGTVQFTVPEDGSAELNSDVSECGVDKQKMQIDFLPEMDIKMPETQTKNRWSILLDFAKEGKDGEQRYVLSNYSLTVYYYPVMNASYNDSAAYTYPKPESVQPEWAANFVNQQSPNGFVCSQNKLVLNVTDSSLQFNKLKLVAFVSQDNDQFKTGQAFEQCSMDIRTSDLVPIIVGACLAGLVIVVLIAYLIGRARAKRQGYASV